MQQHASHFHRCLLLVLMTMVTHGAPMESVNVSARQVHLLMAHVRKFVILGIDCINTAAVTKVMLQLKRDQIRIYNKTLSQYCHFIEKHLIGYFCFRFQHRQRPLPQQRRLQLHRQRVGCNLENKISLKHYFFENVNYLHQFL